MKTRPERANYNRRGSCPIVVWTQGPFVMVQQSSKTGPPDNEVIVLNKKNLEKLLGALVAIKFDR